MYNKTNVNSKCSMRVIKGCTGTTTFGQSAPGSWHHQPPELGHPILPYATGWTLRHENKNLNVSLNRRTRKLARRLPLTSHESEARGRGGNTEAQPWESPGPRGSCPLWLRQAYRCFGRQAYGMVTAYVKSEGADNVP